MMKCASRLTPALRILLATICVAIGLSSTAALAQNGSLILDPPSDINFKVDFNTGSNWSGGTVPTGTATIPNPTNGPYTLYFTAATTTLAAINDTNTFLMLLDTGKTLNLTGAGLTICCSGGSFGMLGTLNGNVTLGVSLGFIVPNFYGNGTINGNVTNNGGAVIPGGANGSPGTMTINGNYSQGALGSTSGFLAINAVGGQVSRLNVTGTATLVGSTQLSVNAPSSATFANATTFTILNATGGLTGQFGHVSGSANAVFLTPTVTYDANNVFLTLTRQFNPAGLLPGSQQPIGAALNQSSATSSGDFETVLGNLATLSAPQAVYVLEQISGRGYAGFSTAAVQGGQQFMNSIGTQMGSAHASGAGGTRVALAEACDVACDEERKSPWSMWLSGVGNTGSVAASNGAGAVTYNLIGAATGIDYLFDPRFLMGISLGYGNGRQWVGGIDGSGTSNSYNGAIYASFMPGALYIDALAGYGYGDNSMVRTIAIPDMATRTARGRTGANQFVGQVESGYKFAIYAPAAATLTPFARLQASTTTQNGFTETGADSLNLVVAQQTTNSLRSTLGAELAGSLDAHMHNKLNLLFRLGWLHEFADTSRPVTAAFSGAPTAGFTVFGAAAQPDSAAIGFGANTVVGESTTLYARYDGEVGGASDNHTFSAGARMAF